MGVREQKSELLIQAFKKNNKMTSEDIMLALDIKVRSVKTYVKLLNDKGITIQHKKGIYTFSDTDETESLFLSKNDLMHLVIVDIISNNIGTHTQASLIQTFKTRYVDYDAETRMDISDKTIERAINNCEAVNLVVRDKNGCYNLSLNIEAICLTKEQKVFDFINYYDVYSSHFYYPKKIEMIALKLKEMGATESEVVGYHTIGRPYQFREKIKDILKLFSDFDYRKKTLRIVHDSRIGIQDININLVTFFYNVEDDKQYAIGYVNGEEYFILVDRIKSIEELKTANDQFGDRKIINKLDLMFGASIDGPYTVKVLFEDVFNIREKITKLDKLRPTSTISIEEDKIVFEDEIYGLYDFARYLRSFGSSCQVLEPKILVDTMINSYKRTLENYGVEHE